MLLEDIGVTARKLPQFNSKKIYSVEDLLKFVPRKYYDFRNPVSADNIVHQKKCCLIVCGNELKVTPTYIKLICTEVKSGRKIVAMWFNQKFMVSKLQQMSMHQIVLCGTATVSEEFNSVTFINPDVFSNNMDDLCIYPVYSKITGMSVPYLTEKIKIAVDLLDKEDYDTKLVPETLNKKTIKTFKLISRKEAIRHIHFPKTPEDLAAAKKRLIFDELYFFATQLLKDQEVEQKDSPFIIKSTEKYEDFINNLPFDLTDDQENTVNKIMEKAKRGERVYSLIQGDVGCGKTITAFCVMIAMAENGYQSALMAPTSVLAKQHYLELSEMMSKYGFEVVYLDGSLKASEKKAALKKIENGEASMIVGTHTLVSDSVIYHNLGLTIVDEEHKFGTTQRETLREKAREGVHSITMSATPIPRTLAITLYGESLDLYNIETMPNGRQPIQTAINGSDKVTFDFIKSEIDKGHQCYVVCPLITESDYEGMSEVESVEELYNKIKAYLPGIETDILTGNVKKDKMEEVIQKFKNNETKILISTTVVEVGVNVPNATVMVIRNAERFGLASLHQLRGRVGRGTLKSYCILNSKEKDNERLKVMVNNTDGFEIAKEDLKIRGTGDLIGTKQAGDNKYVMLMLKYPKLYEKIREWIIANK